MQNPNERVHVAALVDDGQTILKINLKKQVSRSSLNSPHSA
jgi:hypothetical protein